MKVIGIGDSVIDRHLQKGVQYPGGNSLNFCIYASMAGEDTSYLGVLGGDGPARLIRDALERYGVDSSRSRRTNSQTNLCQITFEDENRKILDDPSYDLFLKHPIVFSQEDLAYIGRHDLIHTGIYAHIDGQLEKLCSAGPLLAYDFSNLWSWELAEKVCCHIDVGFFSFETLESGKDQERMERIHRLGCPLVIATSGREGACVYNGRRFYKKRPYCLDGKPKDTLGAGDAFLTGFLLSYGQGVRLDRNLQKHLPLPWAEKDREDYEDALIWNSMAAGNLFASHICQVDSAFGCGSPINKT